MHILSTKSILEKRYTYLLVLFANLFFFLFGTKLYVTCYHFDSLPLQQLFRSNPGLTAANSAVPGAPNGQPLPQSALSLSAQQQQFLAQHNAAYAAQQAAPYVINPGQEPSPYMGALITAGVPQYYGVPAPWGVYPANLIPQQQSQPRRPLTPSQQGAENQPYQVSWLADKSHHR